MYDWHVFPNTVFLIDMGCCLAYRARPNGLDPDSCIFDVQGLELPPSAGLPTAPRQFFDDWREGEVGEILTQDFSNMSEVTTGLHSRALRRSSPEHGPGDDHLELPPGHRPVPVRLTPYAEIGCRAPRAAGMPPATMALG